MKAYSIAIKHTCLDVSQNCIQELVLFLTYIELLNYTLIFLYYFSDYLYSVYHKRSGLKHQTLIILQFLWIRSSPHSLAESFFSVSRDCDLI